MFVISSLIFIILFYGICIWGIVCDGGKERLRLLTKSFSIKSVVCLLAVIILLTLFVGYWAKSNRYIYYWDYSGYWTLAINRTDYMLNNSFKDIMISLYDSINYDDYNIFLPSVTALPFSIIGNSFARYVFLVCIMFLVPTVLVQGLLVGKIINSQDNINRYYILGVLIACLMPGNYYAAFRGYIDVAFLLPMSVTVYLFIDYDFKKISISRNIAISLSLILTWICRRYTIFFIIGFVAAMIVKAIFVVAKEKNSEIFRSIIINFLMIGGVSLGILLIFFREFFLHALLTNYGEMYSAYDAPLSTKFVFLEEAFGIFSALIIICVGILCFVNKRNRTNFISFVSMLLVSAGTFWMTQAMGAQHRMILNLPVFVIFVMLFDFWQTDESTIGVKARRMLLTRGLIVLCTMTMVLNFAKVFIVGLSAKGTTGFFSAKYYALQRNDLDEIEQLVTRLNELTAETDDWIYVAASGDILNCDILRKSDMPNTDHAVNNLLNTCDVDLRDGFPADFTSAKYVVTTAPIQLHLASGQEVVSYIADGIQDADSCIGCHYEKIDEYELDNGVVAKIYVKVSEYSESDLQQMRDYFSDLYPGNEDLFANRIN